MSRSPTMKSAFTSYGPGLGAGVSLPLSNNFFLLSNISALYLRSRMVHRIRRYSADVNAATANDFPLSALHRYVTADMDLAGGNAQLTFAYRFTGPSITLGLGGRYQFVKYFMAGQRTEDKAITSPYPLRSLTTSIRNGELNEYGVRRVLHNSVEHFYGLTFSVVYSIDFSSAKKEEG